MNVNSVRNGIRSTYGVFVDILASWTLNGILPFLADRSTGRDRLRQCHASSTASSQKLFCQCGAFVWTILLSTPVLIRDHEKRTQHRSKSISQSDEPPSRLHLAF